LTYWASGLSALVLWDVVPATSQESVRSWWGVYFAVYPVQAQ
jgi:hypothetical protein